MWICFQRMKILRSRSVVSFDVENMWLTLWSFNFEFAEDHKRQASNLGGEKSSSWEASKPVFLYKLFLWFQLPHLSRVNSYPRAGFPSQEVRKPSDKLDLWMSSEFAARIPENNTEGAWRYNNWRETWTVMTIKSPRRLPPHFPLLANYSSSSVLHFGFGRKTSWNLLAWRYLPYAYNKK
jgi:hypothetical protein